MSSYSEPSAFRAATHEVSARMMSAFEPSGPQLVLRRGQKFTIELAFDRPYDRLMDDIIFTFQFGEFFALNYFSYILIIFSSFSFLIKFFQP